tara:strand:+ start:264 stop:557 length:294 start_codon:yes stop_codon:yes gene_type:complete
MEKSMPIRIKPNIITILFFIFLTGCASSVTDVGGGNFRVSCSGQLNDWGTCYSAAKSQCTKGFNETNRREVPGQCYFDYYLQMNICPISRELNFRCR